MFSAGGAVPVATGFTWTSALMVVANLLIGGVLVAVIKSWPALRKIAAEREANLLSERAEEMDTMRGEIRALKAEIDVERAEREAERAVDRHRINNLTACLDALLLLIEQDPDKAAEAARKIRAMRAEQLEREATEKAAIHAARLKGAKS